MMKLQQQTSDILDKGNQSGLYARHTQPKKQSLQKTEKGIPVSRKTQNY